MDARSNAETADLGSASANPFEAALPPAGHDGAGSTSSVGAAGPAEAEAARSDEITERVLELADEHIVWAQSLVDHGLARSRSGASRILTKLFDRKQLKFFARCRPLKGTKPHYGYSNAGFKIDNKEHEFLLSAIAFKFLGRVKAMRRGARVNPLTLPDLELDTETPDGEFGYDLEVDTGSMSLTKMAARFRKLKLTDRTVLIVTTRRKTRLENLLETARKEGREDVYATTITRFMADPFARIWTGLDGMNYQVNFPETNPATIPVENGGPLEEALPLETA